MLSRIARSTVNNVKFVNTKTNFRYFSEKLTIPLDEQQQYGRRKEELDAEHVGSVGFNRDPIIPLDDAGTKENPILVSNFLFIKYLYY